MNSGKELEPIRPETLVHEPWDDEALVWARCPACRSPLELTAAGHPICREIRCHPVYIACAGQERSSCTRIPISWEAYLAMIGLLKRAREGDVGALPSSAPGLCTDVEMDLGSA